MRCYVFFGIQGSGKGTQAELLSRELDYQHINIGDLFREQIAQGTELGRQVQDIVASGALVPDDLVFRIVAGSLQADCRGIVFDGFPRTLKQAEYLVRHYEVRRVFFLELKEDAAIERISSRRICPACGANYNLISNSPRQADICDHCQTQLVIRKDDSPEAITRRLQEFYEQTLELKDFFRALGVLSVIDASENIETVADQIRQNLNDCAQ